MNALNWSRARVGASIVGAAVVAIALPMAAHAQQTPRAAYAAAPNGVYVWADGSFQAVRLPTFDLGFRRADSVTTGDLGAVDSSRPRADGYGISGGIGYVLPPGTLPFGANTRIELGGSYVRATSSMSGGSTNTSQLIVAPPVLLNGTLGSGFNNCAAVTCTTSTQLSTGFTAWQLKGKLAGDFKAGAFILTPSLALFTGRDKVDQTFSQNFVQVGILTFPYAATSSLRWTDWGGEIGLAAKTEIAPHVTFALGGSLGLADRSVSLSATDCYAGCPIAALTSTISPSATTSAFLANAETSLKYKPTAMTALRAFVGLIYDNRVPGILAPSGSSLVGQTPAGLKYESETSWYAGGGMTVQFAP